MKRNLLSTDSQLVENGFGLTQGSYFFAQIEPKLRQFTETLDTYFEQFPAKNRHLAGQSFFNNGPGQTSGLERAFINGPLFFNWDASVIKNVRITESTRVQLRAEAFNVLNRANFFASQFGNLNINSSNFGRVSSTFTSSGAQRVLQFAARFEF